MALALFTWLLTLHPVASGRVYAAYGGVYVTTALAWLMWIDRVPVDRYDALGRLPIFSGAAVIIVAHWNPGR